MTKQTDIKNNEWSVEDSTTLYGISDWSGGYFSISDAGEILVHAPVENDETKEISLMEIVDGLEQRGLQMPVLLRLENLIDERIKVINTAFANAIKVANYKGEYRGAFPIKVNQQNHVVSEIVRFGKKYHHGLEVGSKAELLIALSIISDKESNIICNGYKDAEFIELGLQAQLLGYNCFFVIETPEELPLIIEQSNKMNIEPMIGARVKLSTEVEGHWSKDSGERSLFGLSASQLVEILDELKNTNLLHRFKLLHFHLGSQIPNIRNIRAGILEACRYYIALHKEGAPLGYIDIGGGLAVDYDGTRSTEGHSRNYNIHEYCADIVEAIQESFDQHEIPHPTIISESGRAAVAHTSVLLFNILDVNKFESKNMEINFPEDTPEPVLNLFEVAQNITPKRIQECYNDIMHYRNQSQELFIRGEINLRMRAAVENLYLLGLNKISETLPSLKKVPPELENLQESLSDIYYGNFSIFQSLPDAWAIEQVFPVMPIHRLNEKPTRDAVIADITCDGDGRLDNFVTSEGYSKTIPLHSFDKNKEYYIGVFLVGAYQETLGDLHNLFGDTNIASIRINSDHSFDIVHEFEGDSISDVLSYVEYEPQTLIKIFRQKAESAVKDGIITVAQRQKMLGLFNDSLMGYTYFEK
ncbi:MAG: biosynthetic arginine decarboxylase [Deltaproteobacteria bacterium]|nr:biosynthetic arginine decarboxylase [Deltaproteobacteria bacterium]